jgi:hypothetical protein
MTIDQVRFKLRPLYERWGIRFEQARAAAGIKGWKIKIK